MRLTNTPFGTPSTCKLRNCPRPFHPGQRAAVHAVGSLKQGLYWASQGSCPAAYDSLAVPRESQRRLQRCHCQPERAPERDKSSLQADSAQDPPSVKVFLTAFIVLVLVFAGPRLALWSLYGVERTLVATLLTFEQALAGVGWKILQGIAIVAGGLFVVSLFLNLFVSDDQLMSWGRSLVNKSTDDEAEREKLLDFLNNEESNLKRSKAELERWLDDTDSDKHKDK